MTTTAIVELPIISAASQIFTTVLSNRLCMFLVNFSETSKRWSFDLWIENEIALQGRRIVTGVDLIAPFEFGIGELHAVPVQPGIEPGRDELPAERVRFVQVVYSDDEAA